jgi:hypothetical protein
MKPTEHKAAMLEFNSDVQYGDERTVTKYMYSHEAPLVISIPQVINPACS